MPASPEQLLRPPTASQGEAESTGTKSRGALCYHCGAPCLWPARWQTPLDGETRSFCCAGCLGVAQTIHAAGLESFYVRRTGAGDAARQEPLDRDQWSHWDEPAAQQEFVRTTEDGRREISLLLEGIHCGACVWLIESWLSRQPGVVAATINFANRRALVAYDPAQTSVAGILRAIPAIGYRGHPYDPLRREALALRESRTLLLRMAVALLAMMQVMMFAVPTYITVDGIEPAHRRLLEWASLTLTLPVILYSAAPFFRGAWRDLRHLSPGMDVPVALGLTAAFVASVSATFGGAGPVYYDSVTMFVALLLVARYVEFVARRRAGDAIESVAKARPATAEILAGWPRHRESSTVAAGALAVGDVVLVRPGSVIPADGEIVEGRASVEEALLTGESLPRARSVGDAVLAGCVACDGAIIVRVHAAGEATRAAAIERLVEGAGAARPRLARIADRAARGFVLVLLAIALATAIVWWHIDASRIFEVTFAVLVVSCPCALSLATPAALAAAAGALARCRVFIARADALETLARVSHVVFDKTGTLTTGRLSVVRTITLRADATDTVLAAAAALEATSEHPIARAIVAASTARSNRIADSLQTFPGQGVEGRLAGKVVRLGKPEFVGMLLGARSPPLPPDIDSSATVVALGDATGMDALFVLADSLRPEAPALVRRLRSLGVKTILLSGDRAANAAAVAAAAAIDIVHGDALPEAKRALIAKMQSEGAIVAMVGDGINDAPSLAQAQVSVSLGSAAPLAQRTADVVVLADTLMPIADAIAHARRTLAVVRQNLAWAFAYNALAIPAAAFGLVTPLAAALGMSLSSLVVVGNALRVGRLGVRAPPLREIASTHAQRPVATGAE